MICKYCNKEIERERKFNFKEFCNHSCKANYQFTDIKQHELRSIKSHNQMINEYKTGKRNRFEITKKANESVRKYGHPNRIEYERYFKGKTKENNEQVNLIYSINRIGPLNPNWKEDKVPTRTEWRGINKQAKKRDNYMCRICGIKENLHVHHINPWKNNQSHELNNLITLCKECHQEAHRLLRELKFEQYKKELNCRCSLISIVE